MNFAVFASGHGSNLQAIIDALKKKKIKTRLALVVCDRKDARALQRAAKAKIPSVLIDPQSFPNRELFDREAVKHLEAARIDFIVLAGFMRILSPYFIKAYEGKILNIHPSLLPAFKGAHAIRDAFAHAVKVTGVTVHFVTEELDHGPIILQESLAVSSQDTLASLEKKIHGLEHKLYPKAIDLFARGRLSFAGRKVVIR